MAKFKRIAISAIDSEDIIIIRNTKNIREQLKLIIEADKSISSNPIFDEGIIYKIPITSSDISCYRLSTTFQKNYEKNNEIMEDTKIEYLALHPEDRSIHAKKHNVYADSNDFYYEDESYNNLTKNGEGGYLTICNGSINIGCRKHAFGEEILSETLTINNFTE